MKVKRILAALFAAALVLVPMCGTRVMADEDVISMDVTLNVYNIGTSYTTERGSQKVTVTGDGTYTVVFDCATDLSAEAKAEGVTGLTDVCAIYIADYAILEGLAAKSPLDECDIMYNKVVVDGVELTITQTEPKSALKVAGMGMKFDTNDPINGWDGSVVEGITWNQADHVINFTELDNPKKIEVTFTLSNCKASAGAVKPNNNSTQETTAAPSSNEKTSSVPTGVIIGIVGGAVVLCAVIIVVAVVMKKKKK